MLFDNFVSGLTIANKVIKTEDFTQLDIEDMDELIVPYKLVPLEDISMSGTLYYSEREISFEEFKQESIMAMLMKFTEEVIVGVVGCEEEEATHIVGEICEALKTTDYDNIFDGYVPYSELLIANQDTKEFGTMDDAPFDNEFYTNVFDGLTEVFVHILELNGHQGTVKLHEINPEENLVS